MLDHDTLAVFLAFNVVAYLIVHLPYIYKSLKRTSEGSVRRSLRDSYSPLKGNIIISIIVLTTLYFFVIFLIWPFYHSLFGSEFLERWLVKLPFSTKFQLIGIVLVTAATAINLLGRIARGESYISDGVPEELSKDLGHKVVRHPLYASYCYYFVGFQFIFQSYLTLPLILGIIAYYSAAKKEEELLEEEFGEEYREYQREVGMLLPFLGKR